MSGSNFGFKPMDDLSRYTALTNLLLRKGIPFDTKYTPCDGRDSATLVVTAYLNPKMTVDYSFTDLDLTQVR